jgi:hypothetical protein
MFWHAANEDNLFQPLIEVDFSPASPERISFSSDGQLIACVLNDPTSQPQRFVRVMKWRSETASSPQLSQADPQRSQSHQSSAAGKSGRGDRSVELSLHAPPTKSSYESTK